MKPLIKVKTLDVSHVAQLPYIHDENYSFEGKEILGRYTDGFLIVLSTNGKLDRVSPAIFWQRVADETNDGKHAMARLKAIPQLFS